MLLTVASSVVSVLLAPAPYQVLKTIPVGGSGGWDYLTLDADAHRLYISRGDHVSVLDTESEKVVGEIPNTQGVHGVAIATDVGKGFTSNGRANTATVFDLKTLAVTAEVKTGDKPDAIIYDPASRRVFAFNGKSSDVTAIDAATNAVVGTAGLGGAPEFAVADGAGKVFVNLEDTNEVVELDAKTVKVLRRWTLTGGEGPTGLALDRRHHQLFSGCANEKLLISDIDLGRVVETLPIGWGVDAVAFDPDQRLAFSSNGQGTLTVVSEGAAQHAVAQTLATAVGSKTLALDPHSHSVYLGMAQFGPAPAPSPGRPHPRGAMQPGSFAIMVLANSPPPPAAASAQDVVLVGAGDIAQCKDLSGAEATARLLDGIPGVVFTLGDLAYPDGSTADFANCYDPTWGRHKARTRPSPGNHEYHSPQAAPYFAYWGDQAGDPDKGYYSYEAGAWHVLALNSNCKDIGGCEEGSPEERWLRADLAAHPANCTLAYWHHPLFSSGVEPGHARHPEMRAIWRALYEAGADVVLNGHEHNYERFAPQDPDGSTDLKRGIREIVAGVGGKDFDVLTEAGANSEARSDDAFGVLKLTLHANSYDWEFVPVPGRSFTDSGTGACHQ